MGQKQKREKTEGATPAGRIMREQIEKWNQMITLRFQTGARHQKCLAPLRALFGGFRESEID